MGFNIKTTDLLIQSKKLGVDFSEVVTIGRQQMNGSYLIFQRFFKDCGISDSDFVCLMSRGNRYSEAFLTWLGARKIDSIDASNYESASIIYDMNHPIPDSLHKSYSLVIDSGSLEHIFNFPQAIRNCMEMVKVGGHMIGVTPSNNFLGHGFYQFSPELFFRIFSESNGFQIKKMWLFFPHQHSPVYEVCDPAEVRDRVKLKNAEETFIFYVAERVVEKPIFEKTPQQSDYEHIVWENSLTLKEEKKAQRGYTKYLPDFFIIKALKLRKVILDFKASLSPIGNGDKRYFRKVDL